MKAARLYALTPRQAFLVQHAIVTHEMQGPRLSRTQRKALSDAWQALSRPIMLRPIVERMHTRPVLIRVRPAPKLSTKAQMSRSRRK